MTDFMTIKNVQNMLDRKIFSCEEFTKSIFDNIAALGCATGAYITLCRDAALKKAKQLDTEGRKTLLSGIPIGIKDNICTKGVMTTAGSKMLKGFIPSYDATVVEKLKAMDAIIVGKTNMDEFGMGSKGEKSGYKLIANPVNLAYVPGGSSGGSAASVKAGLAIAALGSDTGGSIRQPASFCGLYGLKPTYSRVSRYGLIAFASSLDVIGPMCKSTEDCAIMLNAIAGYDEKDMTSSKKAVPDYTKCLTKDIKGLKIGVITELFEGVDEDVKKETENAIDAFKKMGAEVCECSVKALKYALGAYYIISSAEASSNLSRYDGVKFGQRAEAESLDELYKKSRAEFLGEGVKRRIMLGTYVLSGDRYSMYYLKAMEAVKMLKKEFGELFEAYDVLIAPTSPVRVPQRGEEWEVGEEFKMDKCTVAISLASLPAMSVPCGFDKNGLPVGLQIIGKCFDEETVLKTSYAFEKRGETSV